MTVKDVLNHKATQAIMIIVTIVATIALIVYATYRILSTSLKAVDVTKSDVTRGDGPGVTIDSSSLPAALNGLEFGYSLWLYVDKFEQRTYPRQVLRQDNVLVTLGATDATLKMQFKTSGGAWLDGDGQTAVIDYVPMSRWVHIVMVFRQGAVTFFMDGEVHSVHRIVGGPTDQPSGKLLIAGGSTTPSPPTSTWKGDIGSVTVLNYYPSINDVKRFYWRGPVGAGNLKWLGMNKYGVRAPVYRIPR
jgi:hypothetical protein